MPTTVTKASFESALTRIRNKDPKFTLRRELFDALTIRQRRALLTCINDCGSAAIQKQADLMRSEFASSTIGIAPSSSKASLKALTDWHLDKRNHEKLFAAIDEAQSIANVRRLPRVIRTSLSALIKCFDCYLLGLALPGNERDPQERRIVLNPEAEARLATLMLLAKKSPREAFEGLSQVESYATTILFMPVMGCLFSSSPHLCAEIYSDATVNGRNASRCVVSGLISHLTRERAVEKLSSLIGFVSKSRMTLEPSLLASAFFLCASDADHDIAHKLFANFMVRNIAFSKDVVLAMGRSIDGPAAAEFTATAAAFTRRYSDDTSLDLELCERVASIIARQEHAHTNIATLVADLEVKLTGKSFRGQAEGANFEPLASRFELEANQNGIELLSRFSRLTALRLTKPLFASLWNGLLAHRLDAEAQRLFLYAWDMLREEEQSSDWRRKLLWTLLSTGRSLRGKVPATFTSDLLKNIEEHAPNEAWAAIAEVHMHAKRHPKAFELARQVTRMNTVSTEIRARAAYVALRSAGTQGNHISHEEKTELELLVAQSPRTSQIYELTRSSSR